MIELIEKRSKKVVKVHQGVADKLLAYKGTGCKWEVNEPIVVVEEPKKSQSKKKKDEDSKSGASTSAIK